MHILPIVIAVVIVFIGSIASQQKNTSEGNVQGETQTVESSPTPTETPTPSTVSTSTVTPTKLPTNSPTPTEKSSSNLNVSIDGLRYPNATVKVSSSTSLILESYEDPNVITDWYKEKIKSMGMNAKSFVTTKANDKINNVLVGANGNTEVRVEITKNPGESMTQIVVSLND